MKTNNKRGAEIISEWPKHLPFRGIDRVLIVLSLAVMLAPLVHLALVYGNLPAEIVSAYHAGVATEWNDKWLLLVLAGADVLCTLSVLVCTFFPGAINVPPALLKRPAVELICGTRLLLEITALACAFFLGYLLEVFIFMAQGWAGNVSPWATGAFMLVIFGAIGVYFLWLWKGEGPEAMAVPPRSKLRTEEGNIIAQWPKRLPLNTLDIVMIGASFLIVVLTAVQLGMAYSGLPDIIPSHFNAAGRVDDSSGKSSLLILLGVDALVWVLLVLFNFFPQAINVPVFLLKRSGEEIIRGTRVLLNVMAIICVGLFWYLQRMTLAIAAGSAVSLNVAVLVGFIAAIVIATILYFVWLWRA